MYSEYEIHNVPLSLKSARQKVERFLSENNLRLDDVDTYAIVTRIDSEEILAGGGLSGNIIKCLAVSETLRGTGMMQRLISYLLSEAHSYGHDCVKVFTKPENREIFESLGFTTLATAQKAIFMEHGMSGIDSYITYLKSKAKSSATNGVIVMNANPFTQGHRALVEWAAAQVDTLYVIAVKEDLSLFTSDERLKMIQSGCNDLSNVVVCEGSDYAISAQTFPTYFLKKLDDATDTHITLDLDLFIRHIAPALNVTVRFVGSEPIDEVTSRYVEMMQSILSQHGIEVRRLDRIGKHGNIISASLVRQYLADDNLKEAAELVPPTSMPCIISHLACDALQRELDTTPKPGLVDRNDNGSHNDMNYLIMQRSIEALRPFFYKLAIMGTDDILPSTTKICETGIEAEKSMLDATHGVNTHRGALFSLGLTILAASHQWTKTSSISTDGLQCRIMQLASALSTTQNSHGSEAVSNYNVDGALAMAQKGYASLFSNWLPLYRSLKGDPMQCHITLLHIIAELDDTNVIHRCGYDAAQKVKQIAAKTLKGLTTHMLEELNRDFIAQNISPGGAADMLSLTIFVSSITSDNYLNIQQ